MNIFNFLKDKYCKHFNKPRCLFCGAILHISFFTEVSRVCLCKYCKTNDTRYFSIQYYCELNSPIITNYTYFFMYNDIRYQLHHHLICDVFKNQLFIWDEIGKPPLVDVFINKIVDFKRAEKYIKLMVFK